MYRRRQGWPTRPRNPPPPGPHLQGTVRPPPPSNARREKSSYLWAVAGRRAVSGDWVHLLGPSLQSAATVVSIAPPARRFAALGPCGRHARTHSSQNCCSRRPLSAFAPACALSPPSRAACSLSSWFDESCPCRPGRPCRSVLFIGPLLVPRPSSTSVHLDLHYFCTTVSSRGPRERGRRAQ